MGICWFDVGTPLVFNSLLFRDIQDIYKCKIKDYRLEIGKIAGPNPIGNVVGIKHNEMEA